MAKVFSVGQVSVVSERQWALALVHEAGLGICYHRATCCGIPRMPDCYVTLEASEHLRSEHVLHQPHCSMSSCYTGIVYGNYAGRFLSAMLQCVEGEVG